MWHIAEPTLIEKIWKYLNSPQHSPYSIAIRELAQKLLERGWGDASDVEDILYLMDPRTNFRFKEVTKLFGFPVSGMYERPSYRQRQCFGHLALQNPDIASLLIRMESLGFAIDPAVLVTPLAAPLKKKGHLSDSELSIFWYARERLKNAPVTIVADPQSIGRPSAEIRTPAGIRIELSRGLDGQATMLVAFAPKFRQRGVAYPRAA